MARVTDGGPAASIGDSARYLAMTDDGRVSAVGRTERAARRALRRRVRRESR